MVPIVSMKTRSGKRKSTITSKHERPQTEKLGVTGDWDVTPIVKPTPSTRYAQLKPWLELVALLPPPLFESIPDRPGEGRWKFPPEEPEEFLRRLDESGLDLKQRCKWGGDIPTPDDDEIGMMIPETPEERAERARRYRRIAIQVGRTLHSAVHSADVNRGFWHVEDLGGGEVHIMENDGFFLTDMVNPVADFCRAIDGAEAARLRRCPICRHIFYARRLTQKACSQRCNATRRVRAWRAHQAKYEQTRKEKPETVKNESKTRKAKARKEHRR